MARKVATSKQTSGGGFIFEDKVAAWFIAHFLLDKYTFSPDIGKIIKIQFQVRPDGWLFDDLLITLESKDFTKRHVAVSVKSNTQINSKGVSNELLYDLWSQYLNESSGVFDPEHDFLCIINSTLSSNLSSDINKIITSAKSIEFDVLQERINKGKDGGFSKTQIQLFNSFTCPSELSKKYGSAKCKIPQLLSRILLLEFDFENDTSKDESNLVEICKSCLKQSNQDKGVLLYKTLCLMRGKFASNAGYLDYNILLNQIRFDYELNGYINHHSDWSIITKSNKIKLNSIQDKIGNKVSLARAEEIEELRGLVTNNQVTFILGKSGYGKSVLTKNYINLYSKNELIWIDAQNFENINLSKSLNIEHGISDLIEKTQSIDAYFIIDGLDRIFKESQLKMLNEIFLYCIKPESPWKIIITCQTDDYKDVIERLYRNNISIQDCHYVLKDISLDDLQLIQNAFPPLLELFKIQHLRSVLSNLKYLDLLAYNIIKISDANVGEFLGESNIIDWIWDAEIEKRENANGDQSARFLMSFGERQADTLTIGISKSYFQIADLSPLPILKQNKVIIEKEDELFLTHDLFGDWSRYKLIRSHGNNSKEFILSKSLLSPLWCKAVRLYGVYLLERESDSSSWITFFKSLNNKVPNEIIIQNLLLESIIYSSSTENQLESIFELLKEEKGILLNRFFDLFLIKATLPNPIILELAKKIGGFTIAEASTYDRNPNYSYWPSVLRFIHKHNSEFIDLGILKTSLISNIWLQKTPRFMIYRKEAADVAIENANWMFDFKINRGYVQDKADKEIFKALLFAVNEYSDKVIDLSLKLCRRIKYEIPEAKKQIKESKSIFKSHITRHATQWTDGPFERPDETFSKICLDEGALNPLIDEFPKIASEIILALLIDPPKSLMSGFESFHYKLDLYEPHGWFPPFYTRGPFKYFLQKNPIEGLSCVIKFVNFATTQWAGKYQQNEKIPSITLNISSVFKEFLGDYNTYFWFRDAGNAPHSLSSALMSLEFFFIDCLDKKLSISEYVQIILEQSNSIAFLGLLNSIGKYKPELFLNVLKPLLPILEFYNWEKMLGYGGGIEGHQMIGSNFYDPSTYKLAKQWNELPHRKKSLQQVVLILYLSSNEIKELFIDIIIKWKEDLKEIEKHGYVDPYRNNLISQFERENYSIETDNDHDYVVYTEPKIVTDKLKFVREESKSDREDFTSPFIFQQAIEKDIKYSIEEIEILQSSIETKIKIETNDPYDIISSKYQIICGGFAVLVNNKNVWIDKHPDYLNWIINYTEKILDEYDNQDNEISMIDIGFSWISFVAFYIVILWIENPKDKRLRKLIGITLLKSSYSVQSKLFLNISKNLQWSNVYFIQLQNLLIQLSIRRYRITRQNNEFINEPKPSNRMSRFLNWIGLSNFFNKEGSIERIISENTILNDFVKLKTSTTLMNWSNLRLDAPTYNRRRRWGNNEEEETGKESGLDVFMIQHAFESIPNINAKLDKSEYNYLLQFWSQILEQMLYELGETKENTSQISGYPNEFNIWALKRLSNLILNMKSEDNPDQIWSPIFELGHKAHLWVENFIQYFYLHNLDHKERYKEFFIELDKMIEFAKTNDNWKSKQSYDQDEIWESLIGLSEMHIRLWKDDFKDFLEQLSTRIFNWSRTRIYNQEVIRKIINLLYTQSGEVFIKQGISLIHAYIIWNIESKKVPAPTGFVFVDFKYEETLARTISHLWENQQDLIKSDKTMFNSFKEIVIYLMSKQNPIGLELQDKIIQ